MTYFPLNPDQLNANFSEAGYRPRTDVGRIIEYQEPPDLIGMVSGRWKQSAFIGNVISSEANLSSIFASDHIRVTFTQDQERADRVDFGFSSDDPFSETVVIRHQDISMIDRLHQNQRVITPLSDVINSSYRMNWKEGLIRQSVKSAWFSASIKFSGMAPIKLADTLQNVWFVPEQLYMPLNGDALDADFKIRRYKPHFQDDLGKELKQVVSNAVVQSKVVDDRSVTALGAAAWGGNSRRWRVVNGTVTSEYDSDPYSLEVPTQPLQPLWIIMNTVTCFTVEDGQEVALESLTIRGGRESWLWSFDAVLADPSHIDRVRPGPDGLVSVQVVINDRSMVFMVEGFSRTRRFGEDSFSIKGISETAKMGAPYALPTSGSVTAVSNASQQASAAVANTGVSLDWQTVDWNIPVSGYEWSNKTPFERVSELTKAAGGFIASEFDSPIVTVKPRYAYMPWDWTPAHASIEIPLSLIESESYQWQPKPAYNGILVSGISQGAAVQGQRNGTDGQYLAPEVMDQLILAPQVGQERARQELAQGGDQAVVSYTLPIMPSPEPLGILKPGQLLAVNDSGSVDVGLVDSVSVSAQWGSDGLDISQSVSVIKHFY